jgi:hypothetical protein
MVEPAHIQPTHALASSNCYTAYVQCVLQDDVTLKLHNMRGAHVMCCTSWHLPGV